MVPFTISEESVQHLKELLAREAHARPDQGIRIYISGLSGFGPEWSLTLDTYVQEIDECCEFDELKVIVERELLEAVGGLDVQYESMADGGGFLITALAPEVQALYGGGCHGGCGGCHGGCGGCHGDCDGNCDNCEGNCGCCHDHEDE